MLMNYSEHKEAVQEFYQDLESPLDEIGYIVEGEYIDYEGYDFSEIQGELKEIFESDVIDGLKEKLGDDFEVFYNDYLKVQQEYNKL